MPVYTTPNMTPPIPTAEINKMIANINLGVDRGIYSQQAVGPITVSDGVNPATLISYTLASNNLPALVISTISIRFTSTTATAVSFYMTVDGVDQAKYGSIKVASGLQFPVTVIHYIPTDGTNFILKASVDNGALGTTGTIDHVALTHMRM
jgi:hypothetical protein